MPVSEFANDSSFRLAVGEVLDHILEQVDELDFDEFDARITPGSLIISFDDGAVMMLSQQTPVHEIWLSANYRAWHFVRRDDCWIERDTSEDMFALLGGMLSEKLGEPVSLEA